MKGLIFLGLFCISTDAWAQTAGLISSPPSILLTSNIVERTRHSQVMETVRRSVAANGTIGMKTNRLTRIGNGLNVRDGRGGFTEALSTVQLFQDAIACTGNGYRAIISRHLLDPNGVVDLETSDGKRMVSSPLAIGFYSPATTQTVWLAQLQNSQPIISSNTITFADCFQSIDGSGSGIHANITYQYGIGHWSQTVTLTAKPLVTPADFQMGEDAQLVIATEFLQAPEPARKANVLKREKDPTKRAQHPDLVDEHLAFGEMSMHLGRAFSSSTVRTNRGVAVAKQWMVTDDHRTLLLEKLEWRSAVADLNKLPPTAANPGADRRRANLDLPQRPVAQKMNGSDLKVPATELSAVPVNPQSPFSTRLDQVIHSQPGTATISTLENQSLLASAGTRTGRGYAVDYELIEDAQYFTFGTGGEDSYVVDSEVYLEDPGFYGVNIVIKYTAGSGINLSGNFSGSYSQIICTSFYDDSVGEVTEHGAGWSYGNYAFALESLETDVTFADLDIRWCYQDLTVDGSGEYNLTVDTCHFSDSGVGVNAGSISGVYFGALYSCGLSTLYNETTPGTVHMTSLTVCPDSDHDNLPDAWEMEYFGHLGVSTNADFDGDGINNLHDYQSGWDPNVAQFHLGFASYYVNSGSVTGMVTVESGAPSQMAILVNNTNLAGASWQSFHTNAVITFGATNGDYKIWVGLRGLSTNSEPSWRIETLSYDTNPPVFYIAQPTSNITARPLIQLQGYCPEPLRRISFDQTSAGHSNVTGIITAEAYSTNTHKFTTNFFQCFDIGLTNGTNIITLRATDLAGNVTTSNLTYVLDLNADTNPPVFSLVWPQDGEQLSAAQSTFTLRGTLNDPTATIQASMVDTNGNTNVVEGLVERDGKVWIEGLPLNPGTNIVYVLTTNAAGRGSQTNISVIQSSVTLTMNAISTAQSHMDMTGTINSTNYAVWANGIRAILSATTNGYYAWTVTNMSLGMGGTAVAQVRAIPYSANSGNGSAGYANQADPSLSNPSAFGSIALQQDVDRESRFYAASVNYDLDIWAKTYTYDLPAEATYEWNHGGWTSLLQQPNATNGGAWKQYYSQWWPGNWIGTSTISGSFPARDTLPIGGYSSVFWLTWPYLGWENGTREDDAFITNPATWSSYDEYTVHYYFPAYPTLHETTSETVIYSIGSQWILQTGGKSLAGKSKLFVLKAAMHSYDYHIGPPHGDWGEWIFHTNPPTSITVAGQPLDASGSAPLVMPAGQMVPITLNAPGSERSTDKRSATDYGYLQSLVRIQANGVTLNEDAIPTNAEFSVGQPVIFSYALSSVPEGLKSVSVQWAFGGTFVNTHTNDVPGGSFPNSSEHYYADNNLLTNATPTNWWVSGSFNPATAYLVSATISITFSNGQSVFIPATGQFHIHRPQLYNYVEDHDSIGAYIYTNFSDSVIIFETNPAAGYHVGIHSEFPGLAGITQLGNGYLTNAIGGYSGNGTNGLDNEEFYPLAFFNPSGLLPITSGASTNVVFLDDAPNINCSGHTEIHLNFIDFIRFKPDGDNSIFVTLGTVNWHIHATAIFSTNHYALSGNVDGDLDNIYTDTQQFPQWFFTLVNTNN